MHSKIWDCIVIGAGISGVSFAHLLKQKGEDVLLLEKDDRIGGRMCTRVADNYPDYQRELGSHTCYNSYRHLIDLAKSANLQDQMCPLDKGPYLIYNNKEIVSISSALSFTGLLLHGFHLFFEKREGKSVKEYFSPIVGSKNYNQLFTYLFRAVICQFPDDYPTTLFLKKRKCKDKTIARKFSFQGGMKQLTEAVVNFSKIDHVLSTQVQYIVRNEDGDYLVKTNKHDFVAKNIALACDPKTSSDLLSDVATSISYLLTSIQLSHLTTINVLVKSDRLEVKKIAGLINTGELFLSAVTGDLMGDRELRSFSFHFSTENTYKNRIDLICKVLHISPTDIRDVQQTDHVLPALTLPDLKNINSAKELLEQENNIFLLGNYFYGLSLEDCVHRADDEATRYFIPR